MSNDVQTRNFKMHPQLLFSIIERQAGTLTKAILEGIMNGVDAKASKIVITVDKNRVKISDDGIGFRSKEEIEKFFETFGQPHEEEEQKVYGSFRMGRGQMFAFGVNKWRTSKFEMTVDIKNMGLDYKLKVVKESQPGCEIVIDLYEDTNTYYVVDDLEKWVKYVPIPVFINGQLRSRFPEDEEWDAETEEAYFRFSESGTLTVYNLGIFVSDFGGYRFGVSGIVVSKKQLKVNFARNDIQSSCPVWRKILPTLKEESMKIKMQNARNWNDDERMFAVKQFFAGEINSDEFWKFPIITDATGSNIQFKTFMSRLRKCMSNLSSCAQGNIKADKAIQSRMAYVIANTTLSRFSSSDCKEMIEKIIEAIRTNQNKEYDTNRALYYSGQAKIRELKEIKCIDFNTLENNVSSVADIVPPTEWKVNEKRMIRAIKSAQHILRFNSIYSNCDFKKIGLLWEGRRDDGVIAEREIKIGQSDCCQGWTDGLSYIALNRILFENANMNIDSWGIIGCVLLHEYCHDVSTKMSHVHNTEFYQEFHDRAGRIAMFAEQAFTRYCKILESEGRKMSKRMEKIKTLQKEEVVAG